MLHRGGNRSLIITQRRGPLERNSTDPLIATIVMEAPLRACRARHLFNLTQASVDATHTDQHDRDTAQKPMTAGELEEPILRRPGPVPPYPIGWVERLVWRLPLYSLQICSNLWNAPVKPSRASPTGSVRVAARIRRLTYRRWASSRRK